LRGTFSGRVAEGASLLEELKSGFGYVAIWRGRAIAGARGGHDRRTEQRKARESREATHHGTATVGDP
jgi:hypothetical protein